MTKTHDVVAWFPVRCTNGKWAWLRPVHRITHRLGEEFGNVYLDPRESVLQQDGPVRRDSVLDNLRRRDGEVFVIPSWLHRYSTCGDWYDDGKKIEVYVSDLGEWRSEWCVAIHELIEALVCRHTGVAPEAATNFDIMFERERAAGKHGADDEPGDDPRAPYRDAHRFATKVELMLSEKLGLSWVRHEDVISRTLD